MLRWGMGMTPGPTATEYLDSGRDVQLEGWERAVREWVPGEGESRP